MFTHFKNKKRQLITTLFAVLLTVQMWNNAIYAQTITPIVTVAPPYSNKLMDYISQPNKIMAVLTVSTQDFNSLSTYVEGNISSLDGNIQIYTRPGHKPAIPITIEKTAGGVFMPYTLNYNDIRTVFDDNWLMYKGISRNQVLKDGLPEGIYHICFKVFDYNTNEQLSNEGCSNTFNVSSVDAPVIMQPLDKSQIQFMPVQSMVFSWTPPPGAPVTTKYKLRIVEMNKNMSFNPIDALRSSSYPKFFETTVTGTTYLYSAANPALTPGKEYAFIVVADDPVGGTKFKNNGASQMHVFTYNEPQTPMSGTMNNPIPPGNNNFTTNIDVQTTPPPFQITKVSGVLKYKYPNGNESYPLKNATIKLVAKYYVYNSNNIFYGILDNDNYLTGQPYYSNGPDVNEVVANCTTSNSGDFEFTFLGNYQMGLLDDNFICPGQTVQNFIEQELFNTYLACNENSYVDYTNPNAYMGFNQEYASSGTVLSSEGCLTNALCKLYRYFVIEIDAPHNNFYLNPDKEEDHKLAPEPGSTTDMGDVITPVRTFDISVKVENANPNSMTITPDPDAGAGLDGVTVYILRKMILDRTGQNGFPIDGIQPKDVNKHKPDFPLIVVGQRTTSTDPQEKGIARFEDLVFHDDANYQYYIYVEVDRKGIYNFNMSSPQWLDLKTFMANGSSVGVINPQLNDYSDFIEKHSASNWTIPNISKTFKLEPLFPSIKVSVKNLLQQSIINNPETKVLLIEHYDANNDLLAFSPGGTNISSESYTTQNYLTKTDSGFYEIDNLPILINQQHEVVGPHREIKVTSPGYKDAKFDVDVLKLGEQKYIPAYLFPGAVVSGTVKDINTKQAIGATATVKLLDNSSNIAFHCKADGSYLLLAMLLPDKTQYLEFAAPGYITDTIPVTIKNKKYTKNCYLRKKVRKLKVLVKDTKTEQPLKNMKVTLPEVTVSNMTGMLHSTNNSNNQPNNGGSGINNNLSVNTNSQEVLSATTDDQGYALFSFKSGEDNNTEFTVEVSNPVSNSNNYETNTFTIKIPYGTESYQLVYMKEGGCVKGTVYSGTSDESRVPGATVRFVADDGFGSHEASYLTTQCDNSGNYTLRNVPVYGSNFNMPRAIEAMKSGSVGDVASIVIKPGNTCPTQDFHLKVYKDMDISSILGFDMQVVILEDENNKVYITGILTAPKNDQFSATKDIPFTRKEVVKSTELNSKNIPLLEPAEGFLKTDLNDLNLGIWNTYDGLLNDPSGIKLEKTSNTSSVGAIKGKVAINKNNFGGTGYELPDEIFLAGSPTGNNRTLLNIFSSGNNATTPNSIPNEGFYVCTKSGQAINYSINGFPNSAITIPEKSFLNKNGLTLNTKLKANIPTIQPSNLNIDVGDLKINNSGINHTGAKPIEIGMGQWTLNCNQWKIGDDGLLVSQAVLFTGADIQCENIRITNTELQTDKAIIHLEKIKLLGLHDLFINTTLKGLNYVYTYGGVYAWQVFASPEIGQSTVGYLQGLPGTAANERLDFLAVSINSEGESELVLINKPIKLYNLVDFTPSPSSVMNLYKDFFKMRGTYNFGIPYAESLIGSVTYYKNTNNQLAFRMDNIDPIFFDHHNVEYRINASSLSDRLFIAKGTIHESGNLPILYVTLTKTPQATKIDIDPGQKIKMSESNYLGDIKGGINVINHQWETLRFDGAPFGMAGISQNNQRFSFVVNGAVTATGQNVSVSEIPSFPGMTITYDMTNSRFIGSANLNMNLGGMALSGNVNSIMDSKGWLFQADGNMEIPGLGGVDLFGLFGNYTGIPSEVSSKFGSAVCLPAGFTHNIDGFLLSGGITKQILPKISQDFGVVSVEAGVDLSLNARTFMKFGQGGTVFGLGILASGHAYAGGSCEATCTEASANVLLQFGVSGDYNVSSHAYNIDGCASASLKFTVEQCFPVGFDCGPCASLSLPNLTIGTTVHLDNSNGLSMGITRNSCDQQCH